MEATTILTRGEALRGFLPDEILAKKKQGFGLPFGVWANRHDGLKRFATDSLQSLAERGIARLAFIATLLKDDLSARRAIVHRRATRGPFSICCRT